MLPSRRPLSGVSDGYYSDGDEFGEDSVLISTSSVFDDIDSPEAYLPPGESDGETGSEADGGFGAYETRSLPASFVSTQESHDVNSFSGCDVLPFVPCNMRSSGPAHC